MPRKTMRNRIFLFWCWLGDRFGFWRPEEKQTPDDLLEKLDIFEQTIEFQKQKLDQKETLIRIMEAENRLLRDTLIEYKKQAEDHEKFVATLGDMIAQSKGKIFINLNNLN